MEHPGTSRGPRRDWRILIEPPLNDEIGAAGIGELGGISSRAVHEQNGEVRLARRLSTELPDRVDVRARTRAKQGELDASDLMLRLLDVRCVRQPSEVAGRAKLLENLLRLRQVVASGNHGGDPDTIENSNQGSGVSMRLVHARRLEHLRVEEDIARGHDQQGHAILAKRLYLRCQAIDPAEGVAGAAAGLEVALEVRDQGHAEARGSLGTWAWGPAAAQSEGKDQHGKEASHQRGFSNARGHGQNHCRVAA